jgi:hypothetical protein
MGKAVRPYTNAPGYKFHPILPTKIACLLIERFLASLCFEQRGKLEQVVIEIRSFD